jgi:hypothetical protein
LTPGHNCEPSARPSFRDGNSTLTLVANRALKAGDELTISYVDVTSSPGEALADARKRRRWDLARGWRFACTCARCAAEGAEQASTASEDVPTQKDESKEEDVVTRVEGQVAAENSLAAVQVDAADLEEALAKAEIAVAEVAVVESEVVEAIVEAAAEPTLEPSVEPPVEPSEHGSDELNVVPTTEDEGPAESFAAVSVEAINESTSEVWEPEVASQIQA